MKLRVTPNEFLQIQRLSDRASMTIDGCIDQVAWVKGVQAIIPVSLSLYEPITVEVQWHATAIPDDERIVS